jgi:hydrogenase nickel incorporation protein HypB
VALSVTEGEDKPLKYPAIFHTSDVAVVTKWDMAVFADFDWQAAQTNILAVRPDIPIVRLSAKTGEGVEELLAMLARRDGLSGPLASTR